MKFRDLVPRNVYQQMQIPILLETEDNGPLRAFLRTKYKVGWTWFGKTKYNKLIEKDDGRKQPAESGTDSDGGT